MKSHRPKSKRPGPRNSHAPARRSVLRLAVERLEARRLLAGDIQFRFAFTDLADNPVSSVGVGDPFLLQAFVQDIRAVPQGVSSAYVDLVYDNPGALSSGGAIVHAADYNSETSGDASMFPRIEDVGGGLTGGIAPANPDQEFALFSLPLIASSAGTFEFHAEMADGFGRDILLVGSGSAVPFDPENVMVVGDTSLEIVPTISFQQSFDSVDESAGTHTVNVVLDTGGAMLSEPVTASVVALASSTGGAGDFQLVTTSVTFPAGSTGAIETVTLNILPDAIADGNLNVDLALRNLTSSAVGLGHLDRHRTTIVDDDQDRVEVGINLYADNNGVPGVILNEASITSGDRFFVEIVVGDYRDDPPAAGEQRGVIGFRINSFTWPTANLVSLNTFPIDNPLDLANPNPLVTDAFPLVRGGSLIDVPTNMQAIQNLVGFSNPTGGEGRAIGINLPERFSLMHFVANAAVSPPVALPLNVDTGTITLADNSAVASTIVDQVAVTVTDRPVAANDLFSIDLNAANSLLNVLANDTEPQSEVLTITSVTASSAGGTLQIVGTPGTANHRVMYTPPVDFRGTDTFFYTISDGNQLSEATAMVTVEVGSLRVEKATNAVDPANPTLAEDADAATGPLLPVGGTVTWSYQVFNEGTRPLSLTSVVDNAGTSGDSNDDFLPVAVESAGFNVGDANQNGLLDAGEIWRFSAQGTVEAGQYTNVAIVAAAVQVGGELLAAEDPSNHFGVDVQATLLKRTNGDDANSAPGPLLPVGSVATFTYEVSNPGNVPLQLVTLLDDNGTPGDANDDFAPSSVPVSGFNDGDTNQNNLVDPGETWLFTATRDPVTAGQYTNSATVTLNPVDINGQDAPGLSDAVTSDASNHFGATVAVADVQLQKLTNGQEADTPLGPLVEVGGAVTFNYQVSLNAPANVPVVITALIDDNGTPGDTNDDFSPTPLETGGFNNGDTNQNGLLDPGETWHFSAVRDPVTLGQYSNLATVTVNPVDPAGNDIPGLPERTQADASHHFGFETSVTLQKLTNGQDADMPPGPLLDVGSAVTFTYEVSTTGNLPLQLQSLVDDAGTPGNASDDFAPQPILSGAFNVGDTNQNDLIDPSETWTFTAVGVVVAGQYTNTAVVTATPRDPLGNEIPQIADVTDSDASNHRGNPLRIEKATNAVDPANPTATEDADLPPGRLLEVGTDVVWTYLVFNAGNEPLNAPVIVDDFGTTNDTSDDFSPAPVLSNGFNAGDLNQDGLLDPGEVWQFTSQGVVNYQVVAGQYSNIVTASASVPGGGQMPMDSDASNHFGAVVTGIVLEKSTNGQDADTLTGPVLAVGSTATFSYAINLSAGSNVPVAITNLSDDNGTPGNPADDFIPSPVEMDGFNTGDLSQNGLLDPNETWMFQSQRTVTAGQYTNLATVTGNPVTFDGTDLPALNDVSDTDPSNHFGGMVTLAELDVVKSTNGQDADTPTGPLLAVGATANFSYQVTLSAPANVPVELESLVDDNGTPGDSGDDFAPTATEVGGLNVGDINQNGLLDVGETWLFTASRTVTAGQYTNTATVTVNPVDFQGNLVDSLPPLTKSDPSNHFGVDAVIVLEKQTNLQDADTPPGPILPVGSTATFTYVVSNGGNVALRLVELLDDAGTPGNTGDDFAPLPVESAGFNVGDTNQNELLDLGETWQFTASRVVTPGQYTNLAQVTATAVDSQGADIPGIGDVLDADQSNHVGNPIRLEKATNAADSANPSASEDADTAPGVYLPVGSTVIWTYKVFNDGDEPLDTVVIVDDFGTPGDTSDDFNPVSVDSGGFNVGDLNMNRLVDPGEMWQFTSVGVVSYLAAAGQYTNSATATADLTVTGGSASGQDPSNHFGALIDVDDLVLQKSTNGQDADVAPGPMLPVGSTATFDYEISLLTSANVPVAITTFIDDNGTPGDTSDDFAPAPVETGGFNSGDANQNGLVDPGETWLFQAIRNPVTSGQYTNTAALTVVASDPAGTPIADIEPLMVEDASNHFGAVAQITLVKLTNGSDADTPPGPFVAVGGTATFRYEVSNSGNLDLEFGQLVDDNGTPENTGDDFSPIPLQTGGFNNGDANQNNRIDPGETWLYEATRTPVTIGQYTNTAVVMANPVDDQGVDLPGFSNVMATDASNHFGAQAAVALQKFTDGQNADTPPGVIVAIGSAVTFRYEVRVGAGGNTPLAIQTLVDDNGTPANTSDDFTPAPIETGGFNQGDINQNGLVDLTEIWLFSATRNPVTAGQYTNTAVVTARPVDPQGNRITGLADLDATDSSSHFGGTVTGIQLEKLTNGQDADTATGPFIEVGDTATFTYQVSLTAGSTIPASIIALMDDNGTPGNTSDDFSPTAVPSTGTNSGDTNANGLLDLGETWLFQATRTVTAGQYTNIATVSANPVDFAGNDVSGLDNVTDSDPSNHFGAVVPGIVIQKLTNNQDADTPTGPVIAVGGTATFRYEVSLVAGANVPVDITQIRDDNGTPGNTGDDFTPAPIETGGFNNGDTNQNELLDLGETWLFQGSRTVTAGQHTNTASVLGNPVDPQGADIAEMADVTDTDASNHFGAVLNTIQLVKKTNGQVTDEPSDLVLTIGSTATFTYEVSIPSPGNVPVTIVSLVDNNGTPGTTSDDFNPNPLETGGFNNGDTNQNDRLDSGETWLFQATRTVTEGNYTNTAVVTVNPVDFEGDDISGLANVTGTASSSHTGMFALASIAGSTYLDMNNNGVRDTLETGVPGVRIVLFDNMGNQLAETHTDNSGNYIFEDLGFGTYELVQAQPTALIDGQTTAGSLGGMAGENRITGIVVDADGGDGTGYLFGEQGIAPQFISKRMFLASSPPLAEMLEMLVGVGEGPVAPTPAPVAPAGTTGGGEGEGESTLSASYFEPEDMPYFPAEGEGLRSDNSAEISDLAAVVHLPNPLQSTSTIETFSLDVMAGNSFGESLDRVVSPVVDTRRLTELVSPESELPPFLGQTRFDAARANSAQADTVMARRHSAVSSGWESLLEESLLEDALADGPRSSREFAESIDRAFAMDADWTS